MSPASLAILTPDCLRSGLADAIAQELILAAGGALPDRTWCLPTRATVARLYGHVRDENPQQFRRIEAMLLSGPCLVLRWRADVCIGLERRKGAAHPAIAQSHTIRARYWCDSTVMNLVHCSDTASAAAGEWSVLEPVACAPPDWELPDPRSVGLPGFAAEHNGAMSLLRCLARGRPSLESLVPPASGEARPAFEAASTRLRDIALEDPGCRHPVEAFLAGSAEELEAWHLREWPSKRWERLAIASTCASIARWHKQDLDQVLQTIATLLTGLELNQWVIGGSVAQWTHGLAVTPNDIDVRCSESSLDRIALALGKKCVIERCHDYRSRSLVADVAGWEVEFSGDLIFDRGLRVGVDEAMCRRRSANGAQCAEDLAAELLAMNRPTPRQDRQRAYRLLEHLGAGIDREYLRGRFFQYQLSPDPAPAIL